MGIVNLMFFKSYKMVFLFSFYFTFFARNNSSYIISMSIDTKNGKEKY